MLITKLLIAPQKTNLMLVIIHKNTEDVRFR